jgi:hypothetical protein
MVIILLIRIGNKVEISARDFLIPIFVQFLTNNKFYKLIFVISKQYFLGYPTNDANSTCAAIKSNTRWINQNCAIPSCFVCHLSLKI